MTQQNAPTCPTCGSNGPILCVTGMHDEGGPTDHEICQSCTDDWHREPAAPPAGMTAAELEAEWLAQSEHLDYRNWLQAHVIHLRGEVERVTQESIQYDELRKQQIWQLEDELKRLREQVLQTTKAIIESERAALESTTPPKENIENE